MRTYQVFCAFLLVTTSASAFLSSSLGGCHRTSIKLRSLDESIARLLQEFRDLQGQVGSEKEIELLKESIDLQDQLRGDLQDHRSFDVNYEAEALLEKEVEINALEVRDMREKAQKAQKRRIRALQQDQKAQSLLKQAREETQWALDEAVFLESMDEKFQEIETLLLAQAAHDLKETSDWLEQTNKERIAALGQEVQVKDLLWYLVQHEENLKRLQANHSQKELQEWAEREQPRLESMAQVLRRKLVDDHDPDHGSVTF